MSASPVSAYRVPPSIMDNILHGRMLQYVDYVILCDLRAARGLARLLRRLGCGDVPGSGCIKC